MDGLMLRGKIRSAFTRTVWIQAGPRKKLQRVEVPPSEKLVLGVYFAIAALIGLVILEVSHMAYLGSWSSEVFAAIISLIGAILESSSHRRHDDQLEIAHDFCTLFFPRQARGAFFKLCLGLILGGGGVSCAHMRRLRWTRLTS